jgi:hypothetical protein
VLDPLLAAPVARASTSMERIATSMATREESSRRN